MPGVEVYRARIRKGKAAGEVLLQLCPLYLECMSERSARGCWVLVNRALRGSPSRGDKDWCWISPGTSHPEPGRRKIL